jgi:hypothetical protein
MPTLDEINFNESGGVQDLVTLGVRPIKELHSIIKENTDENMNFTGPESDRVCNCLILMGERIDALEGALYVLDEELSGLLKDKNG